LRNNSHTEFQFALQAQDVNILSCHTLYRQFIGISRQCEPTRGQTHVELNYSLYTAPMFISLLDSRDIRASDNRASVDEENADHMLN